MVRIKDLAFVLKLDVSTVSRALRDDPKVKEATKERVRFLAKKMGYRPNLAARSLAKGNSKTLWFITPELTDWVESQLAQYASLLLAEKDYDLLIATYQDNRSIYKRLLNRLTQGVADGALIIRDYKNKKCPIVEKLLAGNYPMVFLDRYIEGCHSYAVTTDNQSSGSQLVDLCREEDVGFFLVLFTDLNDNIVERNRLNGVVNRIKRLKLSYSKAGRRNSRWLKRDLPKKIAVLASSQREILKFYKEHHSVLMGKELYFATFDDWVGDASPGEKVFVVKQNFEEMSKIAVDLVLELIKGKKENKEKVIKVSPRDFKTKTRKYPVPVLEKKEGDR